MHSGAARVRGSDSCAVGGCCCLFAMTELSSSRPPGHGLLYLGGRIIPPQRPGTPRRRAITEGGEALGGVAGLQDGSLDPKVPAQERSPTAAHRVATGDPSLGKSHHHPPSVAKSSPATLYCNTIANLADGLGYFCQFLLT